MPRCTLVLIVSDLALQNSESQVIGSRAFLNSWLKDTILNIQYDYRYMKMGYYVSMQAEVMGCPVIPSSQNSLDAYKPPIFLLRANKRGLATSPYVVSDNVKDIMFEVEFPMVLLPLHPTSNGGYKVVQSEGSLYRAVRSLGMNQKYPVCAENLFGRLLSVKSLLGSVDDPIVSTLASNVYEEFKIPVCRLILQVLDNEPYLCSLIPLHPEELNAEDLRILSERIGAVGKHFG
ncbi:RimK-like ATPgrasp N-terminal domain-containing protein [Candidatus Bathyarchaeota archaeon]|nr:RimK-like ATPgrasp N-terminal domain-containing protein [Candidatus Bathyarchaeota archaeon]